MKCTNSSTRMAFTVGVALSVAAPSLFTATAAAHSSKQPPSITSSLAGKKVLPHRIHWLAVPKLAPAKVKQVEFLIDGRTRWIEHTAPYSYGYNANYLVTSWLAPGKHRFQVRMTTTSGRRATSPTAVASVGPAAAPPQDLAGSWQRTVAPGEIDGVPDATWTLSIDKVGWTVIAPAEAASSTSRTCRPACSRYAAGSARNRTHRATTRRATASATSRSSPSATTGPSRATR